MTDVTSVESLPRTGSAKPSARLKAFDIYKILASLTVSENVRHHECLGNKQDAIDSVMPAESHRFI
jgi:hypothetical protein